MDAAKRADRQFCVTPQTTAHTVRSAAGDIQKIASHLIEKEIVSESSSRTGVAFSDPTDAGWKRLCTTNWIQTILEQGGGEELDDEISHENIDFDYEL